MISRQKKTGACKKKDRNNCCCYVKFEDIDFGYRLCNGVRFTLLTAIYLALTGYTYDLSRV